MPCHVAVVDYAHIQEIAYIIKVAIVDLTNVKSAKAFFKNMVTVA